MGNQFKLHLKRSFYLILLCCPLFSLSQTISSEIQYLKIGDLELTNDSLFLWQKLRPMLGRMDRTPGTPQKIALSTKEKTKFIRLVKKLNLLNIKSNDQQESGFLPFEITYRLNGQNQTISAYQPGMSKAESANFEEYLATIGKIIDRKKANENLLLTQADGQYQLRNPQKYQLLIGPSGWISYEKTNGKLNRTAVPLLIVNGKVKEPNVIDNLNPKKIKSINVLKSPKADSLYGERAKYGVILISTK